MKNTQKLSELKNLNIVQNPEEVKGGFFFFLFSHFTYGYRAPVYQAPKNNGYYGGKKSH
jgi:hypothetical protein